MTPYYESASTGGRSGVAQVRHSKSEHKLIALNTGSIYDTIYKKDIHRYGPRVSTNVASMIYNESKK